MAAALSLAKSHSLSFFDFHSLTLKPSPHLKLPNNIKVHFRRLPYFPSSSSSGNRVKRQISPTTFNKIEPDSEDEEESAGVKAALSMLSLYKKEISPLLPKSCRYVPSCSEYSMIAYKKYGVVKGTVLTAWRLCRCNPYGGSGFDPPRWFGEERVSEESDL